MGSNYLAGCNLGDPTSVTCLSVEAIWSSNRLVVCHEQGRPGEPTQETVVKIEVNEVGDLVIWLE